VAEMLGVRFDVLRNVHAPRAAVALQIVCRIP